MATQFDGAVTGFATFFGYFRRVAEEIGIEKATALYTEAQIRHGREFGSSLKQQSKGQHDAMTASALVLPALEQGAGFTAQTMEKSPRRVVYRFGRCPFYEGAKAAGMDEGSIESVCRAGSLKYMDAAVKQLSPRLCHELRKMRSSSDDFCEEAIAVIE